MNWTIREMKESYFEPILLLLNASDISTEYLTHDGFKKMLERSGRFCFVAVVDEKIVGSIFGEHDGGFTGSMRRLAVDTNYRRRGIASALVKRVIEEFEKSGIPWKYVHVEKSNAASIQLFKKLGFHLRDTHCLMDRECSEH